MLTALQNNAQLWEVINLQLEYSVKITRRGAFTCTK